MEDGCTLRQHLEVIHRCTGIPPEELRAPPIPEELRYLWDLFRKLCRKRQNGMAVNPLSSAEILAWEVRQRVRYEPWEHDVIDRLDALYVAHHSRRE